jgi:hypothetical protein
MQNNARTAAKQANAERKAAERLRVMEHYYWHADNDLKDLEVLHDRMLKLRESIGER